MSIKMAMESAAADDLDLTLTNACGILNAQSTHLKALACSPSLLPSIPLSH